MSSDVSSAAGVVIDTAVFGARLSPARTSLATEYAPLVAGQAAYVSFMTVAELRFGARLANWGESRLRRLESLLAAAVIVWPGEGLVDTYRAPYGSASPSSPTTASSETSRASSR